MNDQGREAWIRRTLPQALEKRTFDLFDSLESFVFHSRARE
jgi:hypothetical protein